MNILISITLFSMVYWKIRNQYLERLTIKYSYKLYDLRDNMRDLAVSKVIDCKDWRFKYLDSSISKTIRELPNLNLFTSLLLYLRYRKDINFQTHTEEIAKSMSENNAFKLGYENYSIIVIVYVFEKHFWIKAFLRVLRKLHLLFSKNKIDAFKSDIKSAINFVRIAPETSTAFRYYA